MTQKKYKIAQLSKDLNVSSKTILELMKTGGVEKKTGGMLEDSELDLFFDRITEENQLQNLDEYVAGTAKIVMVAEKKEEPKAEELKKEAVKAEVPKKEAPQTEEPKKAPVQAEEPKKAPAQAEEPKKERRGASGDQYH